MRQQELKVRPRPEALEGRALCARLIPELRPTAFQVGRYVSLAPSPDGELQRSLVDIRVAPDGKGFVATRKDPSTGEAIRLWTTTFDETTGAIVVHQSARDGGAFTGVWTKFGPRTIQIEGRKTNPDGSTAPERLIINRLGRGLVLYSEHLLIGNRFQTVDVRLQRKI